MGYAWLHERVHFHTGQLQLFHKGLILMDEEVEGADDEERGGKPFELLWCGHRRGVINHLVGRDFLSMLQIGPASDILFFMPYELACHIVGVEVVRTAGAIVEHRINKHRAL